MSRQRLILFILVIIFVIAAAWSYTAFPKPKTVEKLTYTSGQRAKSVTPAGRKSTRVAYDDRVLSMALLTQEQDDFNGYRRNIFKPIFVDEQKLLKQKAAALKPPQLPPAQPVKPAPEAISVPTVHFTFLGFLKKGDLKTVFIAIDKKLFLVKKGDKIDDGKYEAVSITDKVLSLRAAESGNEISVPLE